MKTEDIVRLAACAVKASEDSKRAEAHARASRVYAKKVRKEAKETIAIANELLKFAKTLLFKALQKDEQSEVTANDVQNFITTYDLSVENLPAGYSTLSTLVNLTDEDFLNDDSTTRHAIIASSLMLCSETMEKVEETINQHIVRDEEDRESLEEDRPTSLSSQYDDQPFSIGKRPSGLPVSLLNVQQGMLGAATKRKSRRRTKGKAMGVPSPLLSSDEVMIVKRATSPNPSQHSGLSPFVGPHHKYSVRRKQSNCSQQTFADFTDDEERSTSPLAVAVKQQKQQKDPELSS